MRTYIFTERERGILEAYLTCAEINKIEVSKILRQVGRHKTLFEDVYLYLQIRKKMAK
jgi:hypothetical protein